MKLVLALLLVSSLAFSTEVTFSGDAKKVGGVDVSPKATLKLESGEVPLTLSGSGIRKKSKLTFTFNVYVASSYVADVAALRKAGKPIDGLQNQKAKVLKLNMLRGLSASDIRLSFEEALALNKVNIKAEEIQSVFKQWSEAVKAGDTIVLIGYPGKDAAHDQLEIHVGKKVIKSEGKDLSLDFFKIWFGAGDDYILELQKELVGKE